MFTDIKCGCEHAKHFPLEDVPEFPEVPRNGHSYLGALAGEQSSPYVGCVCDRCWIECLGHAADDNPCGDGTGWTGDRYTACNDHSEA